MGRARREGVERARDKQEGRRERLEEEDDKRWIVGGRDESEENGENGRSRLERGERDERDERESILLQSLQMSRGPCRGPWETPERAVMWAGGGSHMTGFNCPL